MLEKGCEIKIEELKDDFLSDFKNEIVENLEHIEFELLNFETNLTDRRILITIYSNMHTIKGLASFIENDLCIKLAEKTEKLIENCKKYYLKTDKVFIDNILKSIKLLKNLITENDVEKSKVEANSHIKELTRIEKELIEEARKIFNIDKRIGEILVKEGKIREEDVEEILQKQKNTYEEMKFGEILLKEKKLSASEIINAIRVQKTGFNNSNLNVSYHDIDGLYKLANRIIDLNNQLEEEAVIRFGSNDSFAKKINKIINMGNEMIDTLRKMKLTTLANAFQKIKLASSSLLEEQQISFTFITLGENVLIDKDIAKTNMCLMLDAFLIVVENLNIDKENKNTMFNIELSAYEDKDNLINIDYDLSSLMKFVDVESIDKKLSENKEMQKNASKIFTLANENEFKIKIISPKFL